MRSWKRTWAAASMTGVAAAAVLGLAAPAAAGGGSVGPAAYFAQQWGLRAINIQTAWQYDIGTGIRIGFVDTGVDLNQVDLRAHIAATANFVTSPSSSCPAEPKTGPGVGQDDNGHGTHTAGIAAADGAVGVDGAAPGASIYEAKVLDCTGSGAISDVQAGFQWLISQHVNIISMSLGASPGFAGLCLSGSQMGPYFTAAWNAGIIPVVAAGNNRGTLQYSLGFCGETYGSDPAVVVAATGPTSALASYSNDVRSAQWGVAAPGGDEPAGPQSPSCTSYDPNEILSTYWTSADPASCWATDEGTSMATPFVAGTLALLLDRGLTPTQAVNALVNSANHQVSCGSECAGLVDAGAALASTGPVPSAAAHSTSTTAGPNSGTAAVAAAGSTTTSSSSTTSSTTPPPNTTSPPPRTLAAGGRGPKAPTHGNVLWLVLPIVLGVALLGTLAWLGTRDPGDGLALVQHPLGERGAGPPPPPSDISDDI